MPNTKAQFTSSQKPRPLLLQEIVNDWSVHNYNVLCFPMKFRSTNGYNGASIAQGSDATYARKKRTNARKGSSKASSFERQFVMFSVTVIIALMIINSLAFKSNHSKSAPSMISSSAFLSNTGQHPRRRDRIALAERGGRGAQLFFALTLGPWTRR